MKLIMLKPQPGQGQPPEPRPSAALKKLNSLIDKYLFKPIWANDDTANKVAGWMATLPCAEEVIESVPVGFRIMEIDPYSQMVILSPALPGATKGRYIMDRNEYDKEERDIGWPVITLELVEFRGFVCFNPNGPRGLSLKPVAGTGPDKVEGPPIEIKVEVPPNTGKSPRIIV